MEEELEHVPWADLMAEAEPEDRRRRAIYLGAAIVGAMVLGVIVARTWWAAPPIPNPVAPSAEVPIAATTTLPVVAELPLYSEADLMADPPDPAERLAMVRAEWFVTDYFTADLEPSGSAEVRAALPASVAADLSLDVGAAVSYVEWARAYRVEEAGDGIYRVAVAFRTLGAPPDRGFARQPVRAVEVLIAVEGDGATVIDLPAPAFVALGPEAGTFAGEEATPPQEIVDEVSTRASLWGTEPRIVSARHLDGEWRVVVTIADPAGARWPFALRLSSEG
ncbi:MAG: hypothetical protein HZA58_10385 [Acidimicrobiia bacterium]|nr:hypothetical protein [Acidimicrobiia bacterium]